MVGLCGRYTASYGADRSRSRNPCMCDKCSPVSDETRYGASRGCGSTCVSARASEVVAITPLEPRPVTSGGRTKRHVGPCDIACPRGVVVGPPRRGGRLRPRRWRRRCRWMPGLRRRRGVRVHGPGIVLNRHRVGGNGRALHAGPGPGWRRLHRRSRPAGAACCDSCFDTTRRLQLLQESVRARGRGECSQLDHSRVGGVWSVRGRVSAAAAVLAVGPPQWNDLFQPAD